VDVVGRTAGRGQRTPRQGEEVVALVPAQSECPGERGEHLLRGLDARPALQLDVVVDRYTGQLSDLFTAKTRYTAARPGRQADIRGSDAITA
jgi:hypothetical protein